MKKYLLLGLGVLLMSGNVGATDIKYKDRLKNMDNEVVLNGISFEKGEDRFTDFEKDEPGLGYQIAYYSHLPRCTASLYVYSRNSNEFRVDEKTGNIGVYRNEKKNAPINWASIPMEVADAYAAITYRYPDLEPEPLDYGYALTEGLVTYSKKWEEQAKEEGITDVPVRVLVGHTSDTTEGVGLTVHDGNFLKVRMTCLPVVSEKKMEQAITEGANWLRHQLSDSE